jgi:hypothetical protein
VTDDQFLKQYEALARSLGAIGYFRRGSLVRRFTYCGKAGCACQASPPTPHGPYYQWTRKVAGKTVTVRLTAEQAQHVKQWIATARKLDSILAQMERLSLRATERLLQAVPPASSKAKPRRAPAKRPREP